MQSSTLALLLVAVMLGAATPLVVSRPTPPSFCHDPTDLHFCSVLPGQGVPVPAPVPPTDEFEVWVLQAPIWKFVPFLGNITSKLKLIHTALGLVNKNTGEEFSFEFEGVFESPNASFPFIVPNNDFPGGKEMVWCDAGAVCADSKIDWEYFSTFQGIVAHANGSVINQLFDWIPKDNDTTSVTYSTFQTVADSYHDGKGELFFHSYTCDDYAWKVMGHLKYWGAEFTPISESLNRVYMNFYTSSTPMQANITNPSVYKQVADFYDGYNLLDRASACQLKGGEVEKYECDAEVFLDLVEWLEAPKYVYYNEQYYWIDETHFDWEFAVAPVVAAPPVV